MEFELKYAEDGMAASKNANYNELRLLNFKSFIKPHDIEFDLASQARINRLDFFEGKWQTDRPETAAEFSAIGYFFGLELRKKLKVPVGLIQVAVGGAPIEAFIDRKALEFNPIPVDQFHNRERNEFILEWVRQRITRNIAQNNNKNQRQPYDPAYVFESGIALLGIDRPAWPWFRDIQRRLVNETAHTGLVVTADLGNSLNVHSVQKNR